MEERAAQVRVMNNPSIASPQSVNTCRSPRHGPDGPTPAPRRCADIMGAEVPCPRGDVVITRIGVVVISIWG